MSVATVVTRTLSVTEEFSTVPGLLVVVVMGLSVVAVPGFSLEAAVGLSVGAAVLGLSVGAVTGLSIGAAHWKIKLALVHHVEYLSRLLTAQSTDTEW